MEDSTHIGIDVTLIVAIVFAAIFAFVGWQGGWTNGFETGRQMSHADAYKTGRDNGYLEGQEAMYRELTEPTRVPVPIMTGGGAS